MYINKYKDVPKWYSTGYKGMSFGDIYIKQNQFWYGVI